MLKKILDWWYPKPPPLPGLQYTWNGINPEIIRRNWEPGDEYWVLVWWKNFLHQDVYYNKGKTMSEFINLNDSKYLDPSAPSRPLTDVEMEALLATKAVGPETTFVSTDDGDEVEEAPTVH